MVKIENLSTELLAAQCVFPRINTDAFHAEEEYRNYIVNLVKKGVGGFCVFTGDMNSVELMISRLQSLADIPLLFCADFEWGLPMRLTEGTAFPYAMALGKANDIEMTEKSAAAIAEEAKAIGVDWVLAPVCDINSNPENPVINIRSFGDNSEIVEQHSQAFIKGLRSKKVLSSIKHFPGHGNTQTDSHEALPCLNMSKDELQNEIRPFAKAIELGADSVMLGHLLVPSIDKTMPASLSAEFVKILREDLKYYGIIVTDGLDMKAIVDNYSQEEPALSALIAGADIALLPEYPEKAINRIIEYAAANADFRMHLIESVKRIYNAKRKCGLIPQFAKLTGQRSTFINNPNIALKAAFGSVELANQNMIPLPEKSNYAGLAYIQKDEDLQTASRFFTMLAQATENDCDFGFWDNSLTEENIEDYKSNLGTSEFYVFPVFVKGRGNGGDIAISDRLNEFFEKIAGNKPKIVILCGNPYLEIKLNPSDNLIKTYSDSFSSLAACVMKLSGREIIEH